MEKDQGVMSIGYDSRHQDRSCYQDIVHTLISNGYEVTVSYDMTGDIITIKYKKNRMKD